MTAQGLHITAGIAALYETPFLVLEVAQGAYIVDQIIMPYGDAAQAIRRIKEAAAFHGVDRAAPVELYTDDRDILRLALSVTGINAVGSHRSQIAPIITRHISRNAEILADFYELQPPEDPPEISRINKLLIRALTAVNEITANLIKKIGGS